MALGVEGTGVRLAACGVMEEADNRRQTEKGDDDSHEATPLTPARPIIVVALPATHSWHQLVLQSDTEASVTVTAPHCLW